MFDLLRYCLLKFKSNESNEIIFIGSKTTAPKISMENEQSENEVSSMDVKRMGTMSRLLIGAGFFGISKF